MCGISGIVNKNNSEVSSNLIRTVNNRSEKRGPDSEGYFSKDNFSLGHRRLSIIDLKDHANQPMHKSFKSDNDNTIVFNGEIFNYIEIREELSAMGYVFTTTSDTEVILAAYDQWKDKCVSRFNGMWAFCIYDAKDDFLFCSRDRYGIKPLYYIDNDQYFSFASEIKQLLPLLPERKANLQVLTEFILGYEDYHEKTFFRDVQKLKPGYNLTYHLKSGEVIVKQYYDLRSIVVPGLYNECIREYYRLFEDSIRIRMRADVTVGTCLSGGLDSSAVAAFAAEIYHKDSAEKFKAIHAKSFEKQTDESQYAKIVAQHSNIDLSVIEPLQDRFSEVLNKVIEIQDEPFGGPSIVMQYFVFESAASKGIKVMLDGQGGDETLVGYDSYHNMYLSTIPGIKQLISKMHLSREKLFSTNLAFASGFKSINSFAKKWRHSKTFSFINKDFFDLIDYKLIVDKSLDHCSSTFAFQKYNIEHVLEKLLRFEDRNSMYHSIETRLPFLDHRLVEYSLSLPLNIKLRGNDTKHVLREIMKDKVPSEVVYRRDKKGFEAPSIFWKIFSDESKELIIASPIVQKMLRGQIPNNPHLQWRFANIAAWEKAYNVSL